MSWSASLSGHVTRDTTEEAKVVEEAIAKVLQAASHEVLKLAGSPVYGSFNGQHHRQPLTAPTTDKA